MIHLLKLIRHFGSKKIIAITRCVSLAGIMYALNLKGSDTATLIAILTLIGNTIINFIFYIAAVLENYPDAPNAISAIGYMINLFFWVFVDSVILIKVRGSKKS